MSPAIASGHDEPSLLRRSGLVVAVDPSLTKTGVAAIGPDGTFGDLVAHRRPAEKAKRARAGLPPTPTLAERERCIADAATAIRERCARASLVVVYQPLTSANGQGPARTDGHAYWWSVVGPLVRSGLPVAVINDDAARRAMTGKARHGDKTANKVATALAVAKLWPDVEIASDDVADALAAAHLGAVALGLDVPTLARHHDVKWSEWPELPDPTAKGAA